MSTCMRIRVGLLVLCSVVLLGASPCSRDYQRSRNCSDLALTVEAGGAGVLVPDCLTPPQTMEVTLTEQITFTSVPSDLRAVIVPGPRSNTLRISAIPAAVPGMEVVRIHTEPRGPGLHQFAHDYRVTVTILPSSVPRYRVGGTVSGLAASLVLQDNNADELTVIHDGAFFFPTPLPSGAAYSATVSAEPSGQSCIISGGNGTVAATDVTSIAVTCVNTVAHYTVGGTVQGLTGTGLVLGLFADNVTFTYEVSLDAPASFTFPAQLADGTAYDVSVSRQPTGPSQTCSVANGSGTVNHAPVTDVLISCAAPPPPPPPPPASVSVTANPLVTPTGGTTIVSAVVAGGVGPFMYEWRGYRDDGSPFSFTMSNRCAAQPSVPLIFPGSDFYIFVEISDCGDNTDAQPAGTGPCTLCAGRRYGGYVRVHEADEAVARFTVSPDPLNASVHFDASASTGVVTPIGWTLQYLGNVPAITPPSGIEDWLTLQANSNGTLFWDPVIFTTTDLLFLDLPAMTFSPPGAYRMLLQVNGDFSTHQTYEYFFVQP